MRPIATTIALLALAATAATTAGCAGRNAAPVMANRADDGDRTCHELLKEVSQNEQWMKHLVREDAHIRSGNVETATLNSVVFWSFWDPPVTSPGLLALDFQDAPRTEITAFHARNDVLNKLATDKGC